jgi:thymidine phosphorylase
MREPPRPALTRPIEAGRGGRVMRIDNRRLARIAKLVGAPKAPAAGLDLHVRVGDAVTPGQPIFTLQAEAPGELAYALAYADANPDVVLIGGEP